MVLAVQRSAITRQLLHVIVDGFGEIVVRYAGLLVEDQVMPEAPKLLEIGGNGLSVPFLVALLVPLLPECLGRGSVLGLCHPRNESFFAIETQIFNTLGLGGTSSHRRSRVGRSQRIDRRGLRHAPSIYCSEEQFLIRASAALGAVCENRGGSTS